MKIYENLWKSMKTNEKFKNFDNLELETLDIPVLILHMPRVVLKPKSWGSYLAATTSGQKMNETCFHPGYDS